MKDEIEILRNMFKLKKEQIIKKTAKDKKFRPTYDAIKTSIESNIKVTKHTTSLSTFILHAKEKEDLEVDDRQSYFGHMAAQSILQDIAEYTKARRGSAKAEILPCQSDLTSRREMAALDKELCRQKKLTKETTVQEYSSDITEKKWKLQLKQLQKPPSATFMYFLHCLCNFEATDKKYFLQCLKLGLNEKSVNLLQPLYDEYVKCRSETKSEGRDEKLQALDDRLANGSLGVEHFFREMAVLYVNYFALQERLACMDNDFDELLNLLSSTMADLLMNGTAIEIMDGDAGNVPVVWLKAVLNIIENCSKLTVFKVSAIGAQGSGKSTLLNTMFGLNFPVSSGRCTRGAYMHLVKVDETLNRSLNCDYIAVIDSEGLMSRVKLDNSDFDNELSTFIIGLSDLTLVVTKDEGSEMKDVLPLAILVFLRMNIVGEHQACHFVYEKRGTVEVMAKQLAEIDSFIRNLNEQTLAAAHKVGQSDQYKAFTDVLQYDATKDNTYVPPLSDGTLMGKTNPHYMKETEKLKSDIIKNILDMQTKKQKKPCTFTDAASRLEELSEAIKYDDFVLGFKNVLAVEAHGKLTNIFNDLQWTIKTRIREKIKQEKHRTVNELTSEQSHRTVEELIETSTNEVNRFIHEEIVELGKTINHYFKCGGCKECNKSLTNRHLLANNEKEFKDEVQILRRSLLDELQKCFDDLEFTTKTGKCIWQLNRDMDDILAKKVQETIRTRRSEKLDMNVVEEIFKVLWQEVTGDIQNDYRRETNREESIKAPVQLTVLNMMGPDKDLYQYQRKPKGENDTTTFAVDGAQHIKLRGKWLQAASFVTTMVTDQDCHRLQEASNNIIEATTKYYDAELRPEGRQFNTSDVEELFRAVLQKIEELYDERFKTTIQYKMSLIHFIERRAVEGFTKMHMTYCDKSSPEALLEKKKKAYHDVFVVQMGQGNGATTFCDTALKTIIMTYINEELSHTELLNMLRKNQDKLFSNAKSMQAYIMADLMRENKFSNYMDYITNYEMYVKRIMKLESISYFTQETRLKMQAKSKLDKVLEIIKKAVDDTVHDSAEHESCIPTFFTKIGTLEIPQEIRRSFCELKDVPDKPRFAEIIHEQLSDILRNDLMQEIDSWNVSAKFCTVPFTDFMFTEVVGCTKRCPFCKVPCDTHSGGKTQGNHSATLHRPGGLGGVRWTHNDKLVTTDCCSNLVLRTYFLHEDDDSKKTYYWKYKAMYSDWFIQADSNLDAEKYWKWVFAKYNEKFAKYYSATKADIPTAWTKYTAKQVAKDIVDTYSKETDGSGPQTEQSMWKRFKNAFEYYFSWTKVTTGRRKKRFP